MILPETHNEIKLNYDDYYNVHSNTGKMFTSMTPRPLVKRVSGVQSVTVSIQNLIQMVPGTEKVRRRRSPKRDDS